jgi:hypothetical protein
MCHRRVANEVKVVGYGCVSEPSESGADENLVAFGYLHLMPDPCASVDPGIACNPWGLISEAPPVDPRSGIPLGQITLEESPHPLRGLRASLTFRFHLMLDGSTGHAVPAATP